MHDDCPICRNDFDLRVQHEMHKGMTGRKGGEAEYENDLQELSDEPYQEELFERQY
jgi:hypothetical protein